MDAEFLRWKRELQLLTNYYVSQYQKAKESFAEALDLEQQNQLQLQRNRQIQVLESALARARFRERAAKHKAAKQYVLKRQS